ncbi:hypothetical protein ACS0TY_028304 [Phlomoides rotata]
MHKQLKYILELGRYYSSFILLIVWFSHSSVFSGVLSMLHVIDVTGLGHGAGAPLASHPHVNKIAFTGSSATGIKIMTAAAQLVKPVTLELGGKSPNVVFEDVDLDKGLNLSTLNHILLSGLCLVAYGQMVRYAGPEVIGYVGSGCGVGFSVGITFLGFGIGLPANYLLEVPHSEKNIIDLPDMKSSLVSNAKQIVDRLQRVRHFGSWDRVKTIAVAHEVYDVNESFPFPVALTWKASPGDSQNEVVDNLQSTVVFPQGKSDTNELQAPAKISNYTIRPFQSKNGERAKLKVKMRLNLHGIVSLETATLEKEKGEVPVVKESEKGSTKMETDELPTNPAPPSTTKADVNLQDSKPDGAGVENGVPESGDKPVQMETDANVSIQP